MNRSKIALLVAYLSAVWLVQPVMAEEQTMAANAQHDDSWNTIKAYSLDKKAEAIAYCKQLMTEIDAKIAQLDVQALTASAAAKIKYKKEIDSLKVTRAKTVAQLEKMERETGRAWGNAKRGFADAYRDLQHAYSRAIRQFR